MFIDRTQRTLDFSEQIPALQEFSRTAVRLFDPARKLSLMSCRQPLARLLASDWLERLVASELEALVGSPESSGGFCERRMTLFHTDRLVLNLEVIEPRAGGLPSHLFGAFCHTLLGVAGPAPLQIRRFFQPRPFPVDLIDRTRRLEDHGTELVPPGQTAAVVAAQDVVDFRAAGEPTVLLLLEAQEDSRMFWRYDTSTGLPEAIVTQVDDVARLEFAAGIMARLGDRRCQASLHKLSGHADHVVRWAAMRALVRIDRAAGTALLESALLDRHPHVRRAARVALERLSC